MITQEDSPKFHDQRDNLFERSLVDSEAGRSITQGVKRSNRPPAETVAAEVLLMAAALVLMLWLMIAGGLVQLLVVYLAGVATQSGIHPPNKGESHPDGGPLEVPTPETTAGAANSTVSVADLFEITRTSRLDVQQADTVRARVEPFLGLVDRLLQDDSYPEEARPLVDHEVRQLRSELFDNVDEPLGTVVQGYLGSLLEATESLFDREELANAAEQDGLDSRDLVGMVEAATREPRGPDDVSQAVEIADHAMVLAPSEHASTPESRARWVAKRVGWVTTVGSGAVAGAGATGGVSTNCLT